MLYIFDLDGTILDTLADLGNACNYTLNHFGYPTHPREDYPKFVGNGVKKLIERSLPEDARNMENVMRLWQVFIPYYQAHNCEFTHPYCGIPEVLETLKSNPQNRLAVASNKYHAGATKIVQHYFPNVFDLILGERENVARKPDPQIVLDIFSTLGRQSAKYIGDSPVDIETAHNAGIKVGACTWGFCSYEQLSAANPDCFLYKPIDILKL